MNKRFYCIVSVLFLLTACGKKGPLLPPEALVPAPIADLRVEQKGERFLISWSRPAKEEGGGAVKNLSGFRLFRREVLPPPEDCEQCSDAYKLVTAVDVGYPKGVVIVGDRYLFVDGDVMTGKTFRYKVISIKKDGTLSRTSNLAARKKVSPPPAPVVKALSGPAGVELQWKLGEAAGETRIEGYNVYRKRAAENFSPIPLNGAPVRESVYEDLRLEHGVQYLYAVRSVAIMEGSPVESELSNVVAGALTEPE